MPGLTLALLYTGPSIQRSASSSPAPSKRGTPNTTAAATLGHKPRQPTRLVADHIPQRSQSAQGFHSDKPQYNYSIHAQRAPDKQPAVPAATAAPAGQIRHQQDPPAASVSDASSTSSYGDAASLFSSRVSTSSNTSVSSADSPPAKPEASAPASLTVNPAMIMMAPTQQTHPLPQKPRPSSVDVSSQGAAPSPPKAQSSTASSKPSGGLLKGKETVKKEKKRADSKYKSAEVVEDDDESDYEPTKNTGSGKRKAPSSGGSGSSASKSTNGAMSKKPKPLPAKAAMMERSGSNSSSSTGRESVSKAPKIESRTAGGARVCGKPTSKKTTPAVSAHSSPAPKPAPKASPSPAGSKKRKASGPTSLANKKSKRDFDYTSSEDEDAEGEDDDDETLQPAASDIASAPASRGRPDSIKRTHLSQSSAAAAAPRPRAPSQALTPGLSRANSFDHHSSTKSQVANPIQSPKEYASARAEYVKIFEDFGQRRKKMQTKQDILRRLLAGKDLDDSERIQIPSKREVTNMVTEVNEMQTQLASLKIRLWDFARSQQKQ